MSTVRLYNIHIQLYIFLNWDYLFTAGFVADNWSNSDQNFYAWFFAVIFLHVVIIWVWEVFFVNSYICIIVILLIFIMFHCIYRVIRKLQIHLFKKSNMSVFIGKLVSGLWSYYAAKPCFPHLFKFWTYCRFLRLFFNHCCAVVLFFLPWAITASLL